MTDIVELKTRLPDVEPPVMRRVQIPTCYHLRRVHDVIQAVIGWLDLHLHEFKVDTKTYAIPIWRVNFPSTFRIWVGT